MKKKTHPQYYPDAKVTCACGHSFTTGSTKSTIAVEICAACHPFFTGEMKYVDTQGRVEKFITKRKKSGQKTFVKKKVRREVLRRKKEDKEAKRAEETPRSLKEMLKDKV